jgi:hypothetical protein
VVLANSVKIATIPSAINVSPDVRSVFAGVESTSFFFSVIDANTAELVGVVVRIQVRSYCQATAVDLFVQLVTQLGASFFPAQ